MIPMSNNNETIKAAGLNLTPEMIEQMKDGIPLQGSLKGGLGSSTFKASHSVPISGYDSAVRPVIRENDGTPIEAPKVTRPNISRFNSQAEARRKQEQEQAAADLDNRNALTPAVLDQRLFAQDRLIRKLQKEVTSLKRQFNEAKQDNPQ